MHMRAPTYPDPIPFRFDAVAHEYILEDGTITPTVTGMLAQTGWTDTEHYTEASRERGSAVHTMTANYDLGAITNLKDYESDYKGWLLAHVQLMALIRPEWEDVEVPVVHPRYRYGTRPDRVGLVYGAKAIVEVKSGAKEKAHQIQTALQAIAKSPELRLPPESIVRYAEYIKENGKFTLVEHKDRRDFDEAYRIIRVTCF